MSVSGSNRHGNRNPNCCSYVMLEESEYRRLRSGEGIEPEMPPSDAKGNYPAVEALRVSLARKISRQRRTMGLTQAELARRAKIRPETLNRLEQGKHTPSIPTIQKIQRALEAAAKESEP